MQAQHDLLPARVQELLNGRVLVLGVSALARVYSSKSRDAGADGSASFCTSRCAHAARQIAHARVRALREVAASRYEEARVWHGQVEWVRRKCFN